MGMYGAWLALLLGLVNCEEEPGKRIVGGFPAKIEAFPFAVSVQMRLGPRESEHLCGGCLVSPSHVLTAAHCVPSPEPSLFIVKAGTSSLVKTDFQLADIYKIFVNPGYNEQEGLKNDLAVLLLKGGGFSLSGKVAPARLPDVDDETGDATYCLDRMIKYNVHCLAIGWGATKVRPIYDKAIPTLSEVLMAVRLPLASIEECRVALQHKRVGLYKVFKSWHICTLVKEGGRDACTGDSGGGLVCEKVLWAIVSWGLGCAQANSPAFYARIDTQLPWLNSVLEQTSGHRTTSSLSLFIFLQALLCWGLS